MSRVIIFCGLPASGKTTLAKEISRRLNIFCLHKDAMKERMYTLLEGKTLEDSHRYGECVIKMMIALGEDSIENGIDVMLEGPFNHPDNPKRFQEWLEKYDIDLRMIICSIDEEERKRRHETRARHPGHHDQERLNLHPFNPGSFDYTQMPGRKLFLETNKPTEELAKTVIEFLQS
ncbi:MAG: ATP-binding protein [Candidatus Moraniibacteriota bacterium]|nr:MAG: ATP-binding protein [Candidatus Moranbacteria bacterium]